MIFNLTVLKLIIGPLNHILNKYHTDSVIMLRSLSGFVS